MSDRNIALALSRSGLSSPWRRRAAIAESRSSSAATAARVSPCSSAATNVPSRSAIASRSGGAAVVRVSGPPAERGVVDRLGRVARRERPGRLTDGLDESAEPASNRVLRPSTRTVTPPRPAMLASPRLEVEDERGVAVDAEHERPVRERRLEGRAGARPCSRSGCRGCRPRRCRSGGRRRPRRPGRRPSRSRPVEPGRVVAHLVDLVDGDRDHAQRERGRARERHGTAAAQLLGERVRDRGRPPTAAARSGAARARRRRTAPRGAGRRGGDRDGVLGGGPERGDLDRVAHARREELQRRAESSSAFSWKPYGRVEDRGRRPSGPNRSNSARWTLAIVGAVSPEPMIGEDARGRSREEPVGDRVEHHVRDFDGMLGVDVVVRREPAHAARRGRAASRRDALALVAGRGGSPVSGRHEQHRHRDRGVDLGRAGGPTGRGGPRCGGRA